MDTLLAARLAALSAQDRFRDPSEPLLSRAESAARTAGLPLLRFTSNDYLGLAAAHAEVGSGGAGASRLVFGNHPAHRELERALAAWLGADDALLFTSGYAANLGTLSALAQPQDLIVSDQLNHASLIDGCRLSRARVLVTPHRDLAAMEAALRTPCAGQRWVVVESYYSMDGTTPDLPALAELARTQRAYLVVDEAHALGVFGDSGRGLCAAAGVVPDVLIGTLGKAFGLQGAFVAGSATLRTWLWNAARSFVFSTGLSPALAQTGLSRLAQVRDATPARRTLGELGRSLASALNGRELPTGRHGPLFPIILGAEGRALSLAQHCADQGILVQAIRPPTVPLGTARIRLALSAAHTQADLSRLVAAIDSFPAWHAS